MPVTRIKIFSFRSAFLVGALKSYDAVEDLVIFGCELGVSYIVALADCSVTVVANTQTAPFDTV